MKKKKWKVILELSVITGVIGLWIYFGFRYSDYVDGLMRISNYYDSHGDLFRRDIYANFFNTLVYIYIVFLPILFIILDVNLRMSLRREFKDYPGVKTQYEVLFYFNILKSFLFALLLYLLTFYFKLLSPLSELIYIVVIIIFIYGFDYLLEQVFRKELKSINDIRQSDYKGQDLPIRTKCHNIIPIYYIVLCITLFLFSQRAILYIEDLKSTNFSHYPDELLITEESKMSHTKVCSTFYGLTCYSSDVLNRYNITTIQFSISDEDYKDLIKNPDYNIIITYKNHNYIVTHEQFDLIHSSNDEYMFQINLLEKTIFESSLDKASYDVVSIEIKFRGIEKQPDVKEFLLVFKK